MEEAVMKRTFTTILVSILLQAVWTAALAESCTYNDSMQPVLTYTQAMKEYRFEDTYDSLTDNMTGGRPLDQWVAGQRTTFDLGQVVIGGVDVRWPQHLDSASCKRRAIVPNVLRAKDRFNKLGSTEFELYTVVNDGKKWRIASQKTLFDDEEIHRWFPGHEIPEFNQEMLDEPPLPGDEDF